MNEEDRLSKLEEQVVVLRERLLSLNESLKNSRLTRLIEDLPISLETKYVETCDEGPVRNECKSDVKMEKTESLEVSLVNETSNVIVVSNGNSEIEKCNVIDSLESKIRCVETHDEETIRGESRPDVGEVKTETLKVSFLNETRREHVGGMLLCNCEECVKESHSRGGSELVSLNGGQVVTMVYEEEQLGLVDGKKSNGPYFSLCLETPSLLAHGGFCLDVGTSIMGGKIYNLLTPHFHLIMLERLMERLVGINVDLSMFARRKGVSCLYLHDLFTDKIYWEILMLKGDYELSSLNLIMTKMKLLCPDVTVILNSTWDCFGGLKYRMRGCFDINFHMLFFGTDVGFKSYKPCLGCCRLNDLLGKYCKCCLDMLFDGYRLRDLLLLKLGRNDGQITVSHLLILNCLNLDVYKPIMELLIPWEYKGDCLILYSVKSECALIVIRNFLMSTRMLLVGPLLVCVSCVFKWLIIMKFIDKGESYVSMERVCGVSIMHWDCSGVMFEVLCDGSLPMKGTRHESAMVVEFRCETNVSNNCSKIQAEFRNFFLRDSSEVVQFDYDIAKHSNFICLGNGSCKWKFGGEKLKFRGECIKHCLFHSDMINCKMRSKKSKPNIIPLLLLLMAIGFLTLETSNLGYMISWVNKINAFQAMIEWMIAWVIYEQRRSDNNAQDLRSNLFPSWSGCNRSKSKAHANKTH